MAKQQRVVLARIPQGVPEEDDFRLEEAVIAFSLVVVSAQRIER